MKRACRRIVFERTEAFTLIELLIVVAILSVLAGIAAASFLDAQVRAKVSRTKADLYAIALAVESYRVDRDAYPMNDGVYNIPPLEMTTPIAYIATRYMIDPFKERDIDPELGILAKCYTYTEIVDLATAKAREALGRPVPIESIDHPIYNPGAFGKYGAWRLVGFGPDRSYALPNHAPGDDPSDPIDRLQGIDVLYDPSNGTQSGGNILRTQKFGQH